MAGNDPESLGFSGVVEGSQGAAVPGEIIPLALLQILPGCGLLQSPEPGPVQQGGGMGRRVEPAHPGIQKLK